MPFMWSWRLREWWFICVLSEDRRPFWSMLPVSVAQRGNTKRWEWESCELVGSPSLNGLGCCQLSQFGWRSGRAAAWALHLFLLLLPVKSRLFLLSDFAWHPPTLRATVVTCCKMCWQIESYEQVSGREIEMRRVELSKANRSGPTSAPLTQSADFCYGPKKKKKALRILKGQNNQQSLKSPSWGQVCCRVAIPNY